METKIVNINQIKPNPNNPRLIKDEKYKKLLNSLKEFPEMLELREIIVDENMIILGGNMRYKALKELGIKEIPIKIASNLTEEQKKEFMIKDNSNFGEWDFDLLSSDFDADILIEWGVDIPNWETETTLEANEDDYEAPAEIQTDIVKGDIFEFKKNGKVLHRLMCGDSTNSDDVAKLMNGEKADMVFTDPPYDIENNDYSKIIYIFTENAHIFIMHDDKGIVEYLRNSNFEFVRFYVANFGFSSPRGNDPYLSHILISQEKNGNAIKHQNLYDGFRSIIPMEYRFRLKDEKTPHNHQKPIEFISLFIKHFSLENHIILDLFLGSGTTMVASHQLNRKCFGMELDEKYCQVIIDRMKKLDSELIIERI